jgi:uncharacterized membrane protein YgcG
VSLTAVLLFLPAALLGQRTLVLESFHADLVVGANGDLEVTETLRPRFTGSWNGIYRNLSLAHQTAEGRQERLDVDLVSITDEAGEPLRFETSNEGRWTRRFQVWVPGAQDATRTVIIRYVVHNAIRFFGPESEFGHYDELYWNVTGNEWEIPIEQATATLTLPDGVAPTQSAGYTGPAGSTEQAVDIAPAGNTVHFAATRPLAAYEGFTVAAGWPPGFVTRPPPRSAASRTLAGGWPAVLPFLAFFFAFGKWRRKGRDPDPRTITVQYEPPTGLSPAEMGTLVDHKAEMHDITATLVDLAVRGFLHIEKQESKTLGIFTSKEYVFHLKRPREQWTGLTGHETAYLDAIFKHAGQKSGLAALKSFFGAGDEEPLADPEGAGEGPTYGSVALSQLKNEFYKDLSAIRKAVYAQLVSKGHYDREPQAVLGMWVVLALAVAGAGIGGAVWTSQSGALPVDPVILGAAGGLSGLVLLVFALLMPARTVRGARAREAALGFKEFLSRVEEDRFRRMITSPEMFERYLSFAMAFRVEKKWARAFEDMYTQPPRWYTGYNGGHFHAAAFASDINALSSAAASTMASSPSGSGGGGSSGGGSGGGGGGGF